MQRTVLHTFRMGDVEDPYLYAAAPIHAWQQSEHGSWCMSHVQNEPEFWCNPDPVSFGYRVVIFGDLTDQDAVFHKLKWGLRDTV
jgi:hypothetical protein